MSNVNNIIDIVNAGIKAETLRNKAIANNIANMQTPGYRRNDVKFQELLQEALDSSGDVEVNEIEAQLYQPNTTDVNSKGNDVDLEVEVGEMVKNTLLHKTYTRFLQKKYQQMDLAINIK